MTYREIDPLTGIGVLTDKAQSLKDLLIKACPANVMGTKSIPVLAKALGMSNAGVYKWVANEEIPTDRAETIAKISDTVTLGDFFPFIFHNTY